MIYQVHKVQTHILSSKHNFIFCHWFYIKKLLLLSLLFYYFLLRFLLSFKRIHKHLNSCNTFSICHNQESPYYHSVENYTAFGTIDACLESVGRLPKCRFHRAFFLRILQKTPFTKFHSTGLPFVANRRRMAREEGIEPSLAESKSDVLPLDDSRTARYSETSDQLL